MENEYLGKITRLLIENHNKNRPVPKKEIADVLKISTKSLEDILELIPAFLKKIGLQIAGITQNEVVQIKNGEKLFLRKIYKEEVKKSKLIPTQEERMLFTVFSAIQLENNKFEESKIEILKMSPCFDQVKIIEFLAKCKANGYLTSKIENENVFWSLGWRFYVEYDDFNIVEYFKEYVESNRDI